MATVRVRGIDLYYEEYGSGPQLVVAHGLMGSVALAPWFGERVEEIAARGVQA
jgi:pimeloyl-ACP methyl ester carboxylesterase